MKKVSIKRHPGLNFKKIIKNLSNSALKYLINVAYHEASNRNLKINTQNLAEELPILEIYGNSILNIRDTKWNVSSCTFGGNAEWISLENGMNVVIYPEDEDWYKKYKDKTPISIKLTSVNNPNEEKIIELHSRSKIFWLHNILTESTKHLI